MKKSLFFKKTPPPAGQTALHNIDHSLRPWGEAENIDHDDSNEEEYRTEDDEVEQSDEEEESVKDHCQRVRVDISKKKASTQRNGSGHDSSCVAAYTTTGGRNLPVSEVITITGGRSSSECSSLQQSETGDSLKTAVQNLFRRKKFFVSDDEMAWNSPVANFFYENLKIEENKQENWWNGHAQEIRNRIDARRSSIATSIKNQLNCKY